MQAQIDNQSAHAKPLGNFEIAPEFLDNPQQHDVLYEHRHGLCICDSKSFASIASTVLRGISQPQGFVDLTVVEADECVSLACSSDQARTLAKLLMAAADDADAALTKLAADKRGGAA